MSAGAMFLLMQSQRRRRGGGGGSDYSDEEALSIFIGLLVVAAIFVPVFFYIHQVNMKEESQCRRIADHDRYRMNPFTRTCDHIVQYRYKSRPEIAESADCLRVLQLDSFSHMRNCWQQGTVQVHP